MKLTLTRNIVAGLLLSVGLGAPSIASDPPRSSEAIVRAYTEAFNHHDVDAMLALAHAEIEWLSIAGSKAAVETSGKEALRTSMASYFGGNPTSKSVIEAVMADGPFIVVRERAEWTSKDGPRAQRSVAVYELRDGLIRRVWYYPAYR